MSDTNLVKCTSLQKYICMIFIIYGNKKLTCKPNQQLTNNAVYGSALLPKN